MTTLAPDTQFGKYRILRLLGQGGMADVYEAEDTTIGRKVALKILPEAFARDQERAQRFDTEIRSSASLDHPNIVSVFEVGEIDGLHYYSMSVLPGGELKIRLQSGALPPDEALHITEQIAGALDYAHRKGFVHRDVKPENILFSEDGRAVLTDFGIAKASMGGSRMTATGLSIGTPHYMSPEQARGQQVDGRSDLYALGTVLYEMLSGKVPFDAQDSIAVGLSHVTEPVPNLPKGLISHQYLIDRLLAKDPDDRYQTGQELVDDIRARRGKPISATRSGGSSTRVVGSVNVEQSDSPDQTTAVAQGATSKGLIWAISGGTAGVLLIGLLLLVPGINDRFFGPPSPTIGGGPVSDRPSHDESSNRTDNDVEEYSPSLLTRFNITEDERSPEPRETCELPNSRMDAVARHLSEERVHEAVREIAGLDSTANELQLCKGYERFVSLLLLAGAVTVLQISNMSDLHSSLGSAGRRVESEIDELKSLKRLAELSDNPDGVKRAEAAIESANKSLKRIQQRADLVSSTLSRMEQEGRTLSQLARSHPHSLDEALSIYRTEFSEDINFGHFEAQVEQFITLNEEEWNHLH